ncbi:LemA family protein [Candidatus Uhrbacteria bacterium]|nr:LemA family protein [Candidatus Uhrbacteria bacterium]
MPILIIFLGLLIAAAVFTLFLYNSLVSKRTHVDEGWSDIDIQLKRRYDLIPNLIETVKGAAAHERETLESVTNARTNAMNAEKSGDPKAMGAAENMLSGTLKTLFAVSENYPALRANENFLNLQNTLTDTENKIQAARRFYNSQVSDLNIAVEKFPAVLIAGALGFKKRDFFEIEDKEERENVEVKF